MIWPGPEQKTPLAVKVFVVVVMVLVALALALAYMRPANASDEIQLGYSDMSMKGGYMPTATTYIVVYGPSSNDGYVHTVQIRVFTAMTGLKLGIFYQVGSQWACRAYYTVGSATSGYHEYTGLNLTCFTGDHIGFYCTTGTIDSASSLGTGAYSGAGDRTSLYVPYTYNAPLAHRLSLHAHGNAQAIFSGCGISDFDLGNCSVGDENAICANWTYQHEDSSRGVELRIKYGSYIGNSTDGQQIYVGDATSFDYLMPGNWSDMAGLSIREKVYGSYASVYCNGNVTSECSGTGGELTVNNYFFDTGTMVQILLIVLALAMSFLSLRVGSILWFVTGFAWLGLVVATDNIYMMAAAGAMAFISECLFIAGAAKGRR